MKNIVYKWRERERKAGEREGKKREHVKAKEFGHVLLIGLNGAANGFKFMSKLHWKICGNQ